MIDPDIIYDELVEIVKSSEVAAVAGVDPARWACFHVFEGEGAFIKGRCRGVMPFIEIIRGSASMDLLSTNVTNDEISWTLRIWVNGKTYQSANIKDAERQASKVLRKILKLLRQENDFLQGKQTINPIEGTGNDMSLELEITAEVSGDRDFNIEE